MTLVPDVKDWSKWWSIRLSIVGGSLLTFLELFPHHVAIVINSLPTLVTENVGSEVLKVIGIICICASPIARVIKQSKLDNASNEADKEA